MRSLSLFCAAFTLCVASNAQQESTSGFSAVPGTIGGQDITGPYDVVEGWPAELSTLPGHEDWTWGTTRGVFAQSPDRIFIIQVSEQPLVERPVVFLITMATPWHS